MSRAQVEAALASWRAAERDLSDGDGRPLLELVAAVEGARLEYQRIAGEHMAERIGALHAAEERRARLLPSTATYHEAAAAETVIAEEIWGDARSMDRDIPRAPR